VKQGTIRQIGQRIVMGEVSDLLFGACALGNIVMGSQPAVFQRLIDDLDYTSCARLDRVTGCLPDRDVASDLGNEGLDVTFERPDLLPIQKQIAKAETGLHDVGR